jgi:hypothetical protein
MVRGRVVVMAPNLARSVREGTFALPLGLPVSLVVAKDKYDADGADLNPRPLGYAI